jgi:hypothetical protein
MNRSRSLFLSLSLAVLLPVATGVLWSAVSSTRNDDGEDSLYKYLSIFSEVFSLVRSSYVDGTDADALLGGALEGVTDALDPFSNLVPAAALDDYAAHQRAGRSAQRPAAGARPRHRLRRRRRAGSPAADRRLRARRRAGNGRRRGDTRPAAVAHRGEAGRRPGPTVSFRLLRRGRRTISRSPPPSSRRRPPAPRRARRRHPASWRGWRRHCRTAAAAARELTERGAGQLLVDLRGAGPARSKSAYAVGALFARARSARSTRAARCDASSTPTSSRLARRARGARRRGTLGPAEVLAAILRDGAGARLVGTETFGWAGERTFLELSGGARLHLTTAFFAGPTVSRVTKG